MNNRFYKNLGPFSLETICRCLGVDCAIIGSNDLMIHNIKTIKEATESDITFLSNKKYIRELESCKAAVCLVSEDFNAEVGAKIILVRVPDPYYAYSLLVDLFYVARKERKNVVETSAKIAQSAKIGSNCYIGHNVVIADGVEIGDDSVIEAGSFIDYGVKIGNRARIDSNVSISYAEIGNDVVILSGARIGQDGFGFATYKGIHRKIFHTGLVIIGNNVEIGANSTIDRGSMHNTIIEDYVRIDNLVQIAHNVHIKKGTILAAQVGIAGSTVIGAYCALGGQVGIAGHLSITDQVHFVGKTGVIKDIDQPGVMGGYPAMPVRDWHRQTIILNKMIKVKHNDK